MAEVKHNGALAGHERTRAPNLATDLSRSAAERFTSKGYVLPLDFLMSQFQPSETAIDLETRIECAKAALPYVHRKLAAEQSDGNTATKHEDALRELAEEDEVLGDNPPVSPSPDATVVLDQPATDSQH